MTDRERRILEQHGTKLMVLKPSAIWAAAMADLDRRKHNQRAEIDTMKRYAFHRDHVSKSDTANDLIRLAIKEIGKGQASSKRDTRLIYADVEMLRAALK